MVSGSICIISGKELHDVNRLSVFSLDSSGSSDFRVKLIAEPGILVREVSGRELSSPGRSGMENSGTRYGDSGGR